MLARRLKITSKHLFLLLILAFCALWGNTCKAANVEGETTAVVNNAKTGVVRKTELVIKIVCGVLGAVLGLGAFAAQFPMALFVPFTVYYVLVPFFTELISDLRYLMGFE